MKIACFSDLHMHNFKEFDKRVDEDTESYRLGIISQSVEVIKDYSVANKIDCILFGGDFFHTRGKVNTAVLNAGYNVVKQMSETGIPILLLVGNHDESSNSEFPQHSLHTFQHLDNVTVCGENALHTIYKGDEVINVLCIPYNKNAQAIKEYIANFVVENPDLENPILLFHLGISGAFVGSDNYPMAEAFNLEDLHPGYFKYVVGGHYHKRQFLGGLPNAFYCGSPLQHSFNDEGEDKGFYIIDTAKRCDVQFVPIPSPQFHTITSMEELNTYNQSANNDYFRVQIKEDEVQEFLATAPQDLQYKVEIQKVYEQNTRVDVKIGMGFAQIVEKYADEYCPEAKGVGIKILTEVMNDEEKFS